MSQKREVAILALRFHDSLAKSYSHLTPARKNECFSEYSDFTGNHLNVCPRQREVETLNTLAGLKEPLSLVAYQLKQQKKTLPTHLAKYACGRKLVNARSEDKFKELLEKANACYEESRLA